ncbi:MAG TPA: hypothetical protein VMQ76_01650 [Terracidiphilus sp.]|nr:hypothetical protein [Terracidiphilus sp.]
MDHSERTERWEDGNRGPIQDGRNEAANFQRGTGQNGFWSDAIWHLCRDGKRRRIPLEPSVQSLVDDGRKNGSAVVSGGQESGVSLFPLAQAEPGIVGILRGAGNAIVPAVAAEFIRAYLEVTEKGAHEKRINKN